MKIVVLDGYAVIHETSAWQWLNEFGEFTVYERTIPSMVIERAINADAVLTNKTVIGETEMSALPSLQYIGVLATGYNVIDTEAARRHGIVVTNIPAYSTMSVAQSVFAHILHITNHVGHYATENAAGRWSRNPDFCYYDTPLTELAGKVMGIVGFGRIGQATAQIAQAFGLKVKVFTSKSQEVLPEDVEKVDLNDIFKLSDIVSLHCPLTPDTFHLVNAERLALMKPTAMLINTSRGPIIDEQAVADALNNGSLYAAGMDVLTEEPPRADCPLLSAANCFITPHIAWATSEARARLMSICHENLAAFANGHPIHTV